jgi:pyocin large subunit-like protein
MIFAMGGMGNYILTMVKPLRVTIALLLAAFLLVAAGPGFRSRRQFDEHYAKHGREFGNISQQEYLERAQALRDAPAGGQILQAVTPDGIISRFDRRTGYFGAYNPDRTIRTFFIPNAGERYFRRQALKRGAD